MKGLQDVRSALEKLYGTTLDVTDSGRININIDHSRAQSLLLQLEKSLQSKPASDHVERPHAVISDLHEKPLKPCKLNVVIQIVGSRGDVQPFVALGRELKEKYGHRIRLATHPTFKSFVEDNGLEFFSIGGDPSELMAFMVKNPGLIPGLDSIKAGDIGRHRETMYQIMIGCWRSCLEPGDGTNYSDKDRHGRSRKKESHAHDPFKHPEPFLADAIIANPPSFAHVHIAERMGIPLHLFFTMPWTPTRAFAHPIANINSTGDDASVKNYMSYTLMELLTWQGLGDLVNKFRVKYLHLKELNLTSAPGIERRLRIPFTYCWSPALIPKPADWGPDVDVVGFFFLPHKTDYKPPQDLSNFLEAGPPPIYIGFGSIVVKDPKAFTKLIFDAIKMAGIRALVSQGWSKFGDGELDVPKNVLLLGDTPHDWLFKQVSAVVHHGGAGTMAAGVIAGRPTVIVPFFGDQPFWGNMVARAGAGPKPIPYKQLTAEKLADAIKEALKPETLEKAEILGARMRQEHGSEAGAESFENKLHPEEICCDLFPERVAVWRLKKSKLKISTLAAAILLQEGRIKRKDLRLYRPIDYDTEDRAWGLPLIAAGSAVADTVIGVLSGVMDWGITAKHGYDRAKDHVEHHHHKKEEEQHQESDGRQINIQRITTDVGVTDPRTPPSRNEHSPDREATAKASSQQNAQSFSGYRHHRNPSVILEHPADPVSLENSSFSSVFLENTLGTGRGGGRIIGSLIKFPHLLTIGLTQGFHRYALLTGDPTVRDVPRVTGFHSGVKTAGSVFAYCMVDAVTGLIRIPYIQAKRRSGADVLTGIVVGFGQGLFGLVERPLEAVFALPGYTLEGAGKEVQKRLAQNVLDYVTMTRFEIGDKEYSSLEDKEAATRKVLETWNKCRVINALSRRYKR